VKYVSSSNVFDKENEWVPKWTQLAVVRARMWTRCKKYWLLERGIYSKCPASKGLSNEQKQAMIIAAY
jgi:hypothetical protein